jgi:hypothetical protein
MVPLPRPGRRDSTAIAGVMLACSVAAGQPISPNAAVFVAYGQGSTIRLAGNDGLAQASKSAAFVGKM